MHKEKRMMVLRDLSRSEVNCWLIDTCFSVGRCNNAFNLISALASTKPFLLLKCDV